MIKLILGSNEFDLEKLAGLTAYDGWGMPPLQRFARRGAQQHGDSDAGYLLEPRFGNLVFRMRETTMAGMYGLRKRLLELFSPLNSPKLRFTLPDGRVRQFDVVYVSDLSLPWSAGDWAAQKFVVTLKANDPTCYDPTAVSATKAINFGGPTFSASYYGSFDAFPVIRFTGGGTGGLKDVVMTHVASGDKLDFTGLTIAPGDWVEVDCRWGYKTVIDQAGASKIDKLTTDSDLNYFRLHAPLNGETSLDNTISVSGAVGGVGVYLGTALVTYYNRYLGI